jgi:hypothetical protein
MSGGMGPASLTHQEIEAWQRNVGLRLTSWECRTLRRLSLDYIDESARARDRACPSPWNAAHDSHEKRMEVADDLMRTIRQMAAE